MSKRIFVNILNDNYRKVTESSKGPQFGLGIPSVLTSEEQANLGQRGNEIYFTSDALKDKKRKLQIIFDSFADPKFFIASEPIGGGLVPAFDVNKVLNYVSPNNQFVKTTVQQLVNSSAFKNKTTIKETARQLARENNITPWKMAEKDFPNVISQAIQNSPSRRPISRLYDDEKGKTFNVSTREAIALLVRESLADALYCESVQNGKAYTPPEHPGPGGNGNSSKWKSKDALRRTFPFEHFKDGVDRAERTYAKALEYIHAYITLIDNILNLQNQALSRSPDVEEATVNIPISITLSTATVPLFAALAETAQQVVREKVLTYFDESREYKTLLNFGNDTQYVAEAWRLAPSNTGSLQLKLLKPLDTDITENTNAFISREIAQTVIDIVDFALAPEPDRTPYLRPFNIDSKNQVASKMFATNATLESLGLSTGSRGAITGSSVTYGDTVFRRWFTGDFKASELNIDFSDYKNFVHFGSAYKRLQAFTEKLLKIEELTSASISSSVSSSTVSLLLKAKEKENIIRNFDPYEQFLYFATGSIPYSASAYYATDEVEYNTSAYWPKQENQIPFSPNASEISTWLTAQIAIAQRFDEFNTNYLVSNLPRYIQEDELSEDYLNLFAMVGHLLDNIKVYVDQFSNIYATSLDPLKDLTMDQVYEVAQSFGLKLPNVYALENLQTFNAQFIGETGSRAYAAETWKRFIHSMVYLYKTKGSRTSFDALLNTYGISSPVLQIKETTYPSSGNYIRSEELTYGLQFTGSLSNFIAIPLVSASFSGSTIQLSFKPEVRQSSSLITSTGWAIDLIPHPSESKLEYGKLQIVSGSGRAVIATSSYFPLFSDDYTNLMLRSQSADFTVIQTDGDQILVQESASVSWGTLWNATEFYVGGSGSLKLGNNFDGIVDEIRVWGETISDSDFVAQAYDPGSFYASTYTSAYNNLFVHVPFSQPLASITSSVLNESPYQNVGLIQTLPANAFTTASYTRISRNIKQFVPIVGSTVYTNRKVTVAPTPTFNKQFVDENGTYILQRKDSIKQVEEKQYDSGQNIVSFAISPTDFVNQNIIRSMGVVDVNNLIGSPRYITGSGYSPLEDIKRDYIQYYNKTINPNEYTRFFKDLVEGPGEAAETMVPARAKLLDGIVIESPIIHRHKDYTVRSFAVDGSATKKFNNFVSGSGSIGIGAYDFTVGESINIPPVTVGDTSQIDAAITLQDVIDPKETTAPDLRPSFRRVIQRIGEFYVTSSILDENSSYDTLEAMSINGDPRTDITSSGYPRNPFVGIPASASIAKRLDSENNTLIPFYDIPPRSNFSDVGTTTYFHKQNGIYSYDIYTLYKQPYIVKLDTTTASPIARLFSPITLLPTGSNVFDYGRNTTTIPTAVYAANTKITGIVKVADLFTLYGISGATGLRLRLYRNSQDQTADFNRSFVTSPALNSGVLFDAILEGESDVFPYTMLQTTESLIYYTIDNLTASPISTPIVLNYFVYEPDNLIPQGYLPRHYKYSRDNTTALKRRNYLGCRSVNLTFDNKPPFEVTLSTENAVIVNNTSAAAAAGTGTVQIPSQTSTIKLGGGGRLNVE